MPKVSKSPQYVHPNWAQYIEYKRLLIGTPEESLLSDMFSTALQDQIAYGRLMKQYDGMPICVECKSNFNQQQWAFVSKDVSTENEYRLNIFDHRGFQNHMNFTSMRAAIHQMIQSGFHEIDCGALDRCSQTKFWSAGLYAQSLRDSFNRGEISWAQLSEALTTEHSTIAATAGRNHASTTSQQEAGLSMLSL